MNAKNSEIDETNTRNQYNVKRIQTRKRKTYLNDKNENSSREKRTSTQKRKKGLNEPNEANFDENNFDNAQIVGNKNANNKNETDFIIHNFNDIVEKNNIGEINDNTMKNVLLSDDLKILSEDDVFKSLIQWKEHSVKNKKYNHDSFCSLLQQVRYTHMSKTFISDLVLEHLDNCNNCMEICKNLIRWYLNPGSRPNIKLNVNERNYYMQCLMHIRTDSFLRYTEIRIFNNNEWSTYMNIKPKIKYSRAIILMDALILFGGYSGQNVTNDVWCFDIKSKELVEMPPMNQKRIFFEVVVIENDLYAIGGINENRQELKSVEMWKNSSWTKVSPLNQERYHPAVVSYNKKIYVFGGYCGKTYLKSFEIYDTANSECKWTLHRIETNDICCYDYHHIKAAVYENKIFVYECFKTSCKPKEHHVKYLNNDKEWIEITSSNAPKEQCRNLVSYDGKLLFFGVKNNYEFDDENKWAKIKSNYTISQYDTMLTVPKSLLKI